MNNENEVENFLASFPYSEATKSTYRRILEELIAQPYPIWNTADLLKFIMRDHWGNSQRYVYLCACRKFIVWKCGTSHPAVSARIKRVKPKKQRSLSLPQISDLLCSFDTYSAIGARNQAIAALAIDTGLRSSELARLKLSDTDLEHCTLQVIIKGGQWGYGVFSLDTGKIVERWLAFRQPADGVNNLFVNVRQSKDRGRPLTNHGLKSIFKKWGIGLGIKLSPHDCRRTFGNVATLLGSPQAITMAAGRWSSEDAFKRYTQEVTANAIRPFLPISHALRHESSTIG